MKLVYISKSIIPSRSANSIQVMKMCEAFARLGNDVILLAPRHGSTEPGIENPFSYYGVDPCFELRKLPGKRTAFITKGYGMLTALTARKEKADLVYSRYLNACVYAGWLGIPFICESHTPDHLHRYWTRWLFKKMLRSPHLQKIVVISQALKDYYDKQFTTHSIRIEVAHNAADDPGSISESNPFIDDRCLQVGYTGQLYPGRGIDIIHSLAQLCPWAVFHVLGGSNTDLKYWNEKVNGIDNLVFHGYISPAEVNRYRHAFDVLLAPYQNSVSVFGGGGNNAKWMSPLKLFEYMATGKAILCSDLPVLHEILTNEETALFCPPENAERWGIALNRLRKDKNLRQLLGQKARRTFLQKYTWTARARKVLNSDPRSIYNG
jgi:glycosyltransferase involved in cell wall biosynthesis